jgi:mRNA-degrading endonuclease toxin of MazEF toxin-antitoxin module
MTVRRGDVILAVSCINLNTINQQRIKRVIGRLSDNLMRQIDDCLKAAFSVP